MSKTNATPRCGARIEGDLSGVYRVCVLAPGHYVERDEGAGAVSWHTDCPDAPGMMYPLKDHDHEHPEGLCLTWSDYADKAIPSDVTPSLPDDKQTGRTVTDLGNYVADVRIGGATMSVHGPARFVAYMVREFATAFEEEAER